MAKYTSRYSTMTCTTNSEIEDTTKIKCQGSADSKSRRKERGRFMDHVKQASDAIQSNLDASSPEVDQSVISAGTESGDKSAYDSKKRSTEEAEEHSPLSKKRKGSQRSDDASRDIEYLEPPAISDNDKGNTWQWKKTKKYLTLMDKISYCRCESLLRSKLLAEGAAVQGPRLPPNRTAQQVWVRHLLQDYRGQQPGRGQPPREWSTWVESRAILQNGIRKGKQR